MAPSGFHILVPVDLGDSSKSALHYAQMLHSRVGARLTLMHVNDALTLQSYDQIYTGREIPPGERARMTDAVREYATPELGRTPFDVVVAADDTARAIVTAADAENADLIVMGTHGRRGWNRLIGGSLAESIMHRSDRPVIAVPQSGKVNPVSRILCPVNFSEPARTGVKAACCMSKALASELHVLHVIEQDTRATFSELCETVREWVAPVLNGACEFHEVISRAAFAGDHILQQARKLEAGLLVMGASHEGRSRDRATLGTTVERVVRASHVPVMSVVRPLAMLQPVAA